MSDDELDAILGRMPVAQMERTHVDDGRLLAWRAGELPGEDAEAVERHLVDCAECRALLAAYAEPVPPVLERWAEEAIPSPGRSGLARALQQPAGRRRWVGAGVGGSVLAAAAALVLVVGRGAEPVPDGYALDPLAGRVAETRAAPADPAELPTYAPGTVVRTVIRPERPVPPDQVPRLTVVVERGGRRRVVTPDRLEATEAGAIRVEVRAERLFERPGLSILHFVLHPAGTRVDAGRDPSGLDFAQTLTTEARLVALPEEHR